MSIKWTRRRLLKTALATLAASYSAYRLKRGQAPIKIPGRICRAGRDVGHLLRQGLELSPTKEVKIATVIVGGGVSGLSAAWWLDKHGQRDFKLFELEKRVGGNSQSDRNAVSAYPWGAHYLPLPGPRATYVRGFLEEIGVIRGYDAEGNPHYEELYLCADPHERLLIHGRWQEGIIPQLGISDSDQKDYAAFFRLMEKLKSEVGRDGRPAFSIPIEGSSRDPKFTSLDRVTMKAFLNEKGWSSKYLHWYVNYCCRDDFGAPYDEVSAWAGVHYFGARAGHGDTVLTWPEGNGWLVDKMREKVHAHIETEKLVLSVKKQAVDVLDVSTRIVTRYHAKDVIFAAPRFVAARVVEELRENPPAYLRSLHYAPWMVANVTLGRLPEGNGAPLSWDNVSYQSQSLGYVVATHQALSLFPRKTVVTYYLPLTDRKEAERTTHEQWAERVAADLDRMHGGLRREIENIDVWIWGHGMIRPSPGFVFGQDRREMHKALGRVHFAHSDMSGISIFEEAQYRGIEAAREVLRQGRSVS